MMRDINMFPLPFKEVRKESIVALQAAIKASQAILEVYNRDFKVQYKDNKFDISDDPLTQADLAADKILCQELAQFGVPILSEEGEQSFDRKQSKHFWVVDPLDGTRSFVKRRGEFSIMIGLVEGESVAIGLVYQPTNNTVYIAQKGQGAYTFVQGKWQELEMSAIADIAAAKAVMSVNNYKEKDKKILTKLGITQVVHKGSVGLKVGEICKKNADFYFNSTPYVKLWDTCGPQCIIEEAGGVALTLKGKPFSYRQKEFNHKDGILFTNKTLAEKIIFAAKEFLD